MKRNRRDVINFFPGFPVQGFDVFEYVREGEISGGDFLGCQRIKHEGVIGVRAVGQAEINHG